MNDIRFNRNSVNIGGVRIDLRGDRRSPPGNEHRFDRESIQGLTSRGPIAFLGAEGERQTANAQDTLNVTEVGQILRMAEQVNLRDQITIRPGSEPGTFVFSYDSNGQIRDPLRTGNLRVDPEALDVLRQSRGIEWQVPQAAYHAAVTRTAPPAPEVPQGAALSAPEIMENLVAAGSSSNVVSGPQAQAILDQVRASGQRLEMLVEDNNFGHVGIPGAGYRAGVRLSPEALELFQNSPLVQPLNEAARGTPTPATRTPEVLAEASRLAGREVVDEREANSIVLTAARTPAQALPTAEIVAAPAAPAAPTTPDAPAAPAAPVQFAPPADNTVVNNVSNAISDASRNGVANDDARAIEAFLRETRPADQVADNRPGFADDGILSEQEATAALNRTQSLRWSPDGAGAARLSALDQMLNGDPQVTAVAPAAPLIEIRQSIAAAVDDGLSTPEQTAMSNFMREHAPQGQVNSDNVIDSTERQNFATMLRSNENVQALTELRDAMRGAGVGDMQMASIADPQNAGASPAVAGLDLNQGALRG